MTRAIILGDTHLPFTNWDAVAQAADYARYFKPDVIIQVGDLIDSYNWSLFKRSPDSPNAEVEWNATEMAVRALRAKFNKNTQWVILEGNHCRRHIMRATEQNIPKKLIRTLDSIFDFPNFKWHMEPTPFQFGGAFFMHGDEMAGNAWQKAQRMGCNIIQGHDHLGYLHYINTFRRQIFGMSVGTLMDSTSIAARYAAKNPMRCWLGFATLENGIPTLHPFERKIDT